MFNKAAFILSKIKTVMLWNIVIKELFAVLMHFSNVIYSGDQSWIFSIITTVYSHMILQKSLEYDDLMLYYHQILLVLN